MKIRPLYDRVVIQRNEDDHTSPGGIVIPEMAKDKPIFGIVVAVGDGKVTDSGDLRALRVKKGDKVLFGKYAGTEVKQEGKEYIVMREDDIMGVVEE